MLPWKWLLQHSTRSIAQQMSETNNYFIPNLTGLRIPTGRRQTSWLFTSVAVDLNQGVPRTNAASGQGMFPQPPCHLL